MQSLAQLEVGYGRPNAQTILTNCATKIALHGLDVNTAEYVSKMLGDTTIVHMRKTQTDSFNNFGSTSYTRQEHRRALMTPDEVMRIDEREAIVRHGNRYPMKLAKMYYDEPSRTAGASALGGARKLELSPITKLDPQHPLPVLPPALPKEI